MTKKGITILEMLISISLVSVVILMFFKVVLNLDNINNNKEYASNDEIARTTIIKEIENDFLNLHLNNLSLNKENNSTTITFKYDNTVKDLIIKEKELIYDNKVYKLNSNNATYDICPLYKYTEIDKDYYLISINILVLIDNKNTTINDDITLNYIGLIKNNNYPKNYTCSK